VRAGVDGQHAQVQPVGGLPLDLVVYEADRFTTDKVVCIDEQNPYFRMLHDSWGQKLRAVFDSIEDPAWDGGSTDAPGLRSAEMKQVGMSLTQRVTKGRIMLLDGSHLFPMERPHVTAAAIEAALLNMSCEPSGP
jgi:hypothetical protein